MIDGKVPGLLRGRREPGGRHGQRAACSGSGWPTWSGSSSATCSMIETATFWKDGPEIETGELRTEDIGTEVFFLPAAAHTEKDGTFTNTQRLLQWHHKAVEPPGDCRSDLWFYYHLGRRIRANGWPDSTDPRDRPLLDLTWDYPTDGQHAASRAPTRCCARSTARRRTASALSGYTAAKDDGSTAVRLLDLLRRLRRRGQPGRAPQARPGADLGRARVGLGVADEPPDPLQPRLGRPRRASRGASARSYVWWDERAGRGPATTCPTSRPTKPPDYRPPDGAQAQDAHRRRRAVHHAGRRQGPGCSRRPAWSTGRCPTHYEPAGVPGAQRALRRSRPTRPGSVPSAATTAYHPTRHAGRRGLPVRVHHLPAHRAPHRGRDEPLDRRTWTSCSRSCSSRSRPELAAERGLEQRRLGARRHRALGDRGPRAGHRADPPLRRRRADVVHQIGMPWHWGAERAVHRRRGQRAARRRARPERAHHGDQGRAPATSARAPPAGGGPAGLPRGYRRRAGLIDGTG